MNLKEAVELCKNNQHLIGMVMQEDEITHVVVTPLNTDGKFDIIEAIYWDRETGAIIDNYTDFEVTVLFDQYSAIEDGIKKDLSLEDVLLYINTNP